MSKQHEALNLLYPGLFDIEHLDLMLFLNLPLDVKKSLLSIDWLYQRFKLAYEAFGQLELHDIEDLPLWDDKEFVCHYLENEFSSWTLEKVYKLLSNELIIDRDINLLLAHSPTMFNCIYNPFKQDREFIKSMLQNNGENLLNLEADLQADRELVSIALNASAFILGDLNYDFQKDREMVLIAVRSNGWVLETVLEKFKKDKGVVLAAVQSNGSALEYASIQLQNDRDVVLAAIRDKSIAFIYASSMLRADKKIVLELLKGEFPFEDLNEQIYDHIPEFLRKDSEVDEAWKLKNPTPWPNRTL